ncbi:hypothetical protein EUTSA_v10009041mg [Eutrema salsugineum]|nr:hypothetical protein EUTSA_v10009041mg [Eutrema salsugineum]
MERIIGGKYKLGRKIGGGFFGEIFLATHVDTFEIVAVKIEESKTKHPQLLYEAKLYRILEGGSMILILYLSFSFKGVYLEDYRVYVIDFELAKRYPDANTNRHIPYSLPWQGLKVVDKKQKYDRICEKNIATPNEVYLMLFFF